MKRRLYRLIHSFARRIGIERLSSWSYMKWLNTYADEPFGFWTFAEDYIGCKFDKDDFVIGD